MATVTGITVDKAQEIADASVVSGEINPTSGHLILSTAGGTDIDAGNVMQDIPPVHTHYNVALQAVPTADIVATATHTAIPGLTVSVTPPSTAAVYVVTLDTEFTTSSSLTQLFDIQFRLMVDAAPNARTIRRTIYHVPASASPVLRHGASGTWVITGLTAAAHTLSATVQYTTISGSITTTARMDGTKLTVVGSHTS